MIPKLSEEGRTQYLFSESTLLGYSSENLAYVPPDSACNTLRVWWWIQFLLTVPSSLGACDSTSHWKTIKFPKCWDWPWHAFALLCCPISGWLQRRWGWCSLDAPASPPLSSQSPIYFLWQFAQIVKIPCNYRCIWKPNMIYIWQAQSSLGWLGICVCMCICLCVYVCTYVGYVFLWDQSRYWAFCLSLPLSYLPLLSRETGVYRTLEGRWHPNSQETENGTDVIPRTRVYT